MFFLIPKNVTSERLIALTLTMIRWRSGSRSTALIGTPLAGEMEELSEQCGEILLVMERFKYQAGEKDQGMVALVLDLAKAFERVSFLVVWAWATHFSFPRKILPVLCGCFGHQIRVQFEGCVAEPLTTITAILPGGEVELLASTDCAAGRTE